MNVITKETYQTIAEIYEESTLKITIDAYRDYGLDSPEFKAALLEYQLDCAKSQAEYQIRRAANQARLYEEGY